jgi:fused signal recognition particle receptor
MALFKRLTEKLDRMMGRGVIDEELYEELEEALITADASVDVTEDILKALRRAVRDEKIAEPAAMKARLREEIRSRLDQDADAGLAMAENGPTVYLFVGVNGVGKTTTIGKLAHKLGRARRKVVLAAGDTFRAAAIEQLEIWAQRTGAEIVKQKPGADSGAVIFDAIQRAKAVGADFVLCDTAGRQHTKSGLMQELAKIRRITEKSLGSPPHEVLLVLDANTGQNAIRQAEQFGEAAGVTGLVLSKLDSTARGGALLGVWAKVRIPIKLIGVGEKADDLRDFDAEAYAAQLLD